jgi:hypothetical protein
MVLFHFFHGRLYEFAMMPADFFDGPPRKSDEDLKGKWEGWAAWAARVRTILRERYGAPTESPSPEDMKAAQAPDADYSTKERVRWLWRRQAMGILLIETPLPRLYYADPETAQAVDEAVEQWRAAKDAAAKARF